MADCGEITISCPEITCQADLQVAWTTLCSEMQSAIDQLKACIEGYSLPSLDPCNLKADFVDCPLSCNMIDFTGITYDDEAGVCKLPYPLSGLQARYGSGITAVAFTEASGWISVAVTFDTPFDTECVFPDVRITSCHEVVTTPSPGPNLCMQYHPIIQYETITVNGFTVWFKSDDPDTTFVTFRYLAWGL